MQRFVGVERHVGMCFSRLFRVSRFLLLSLIPISCMYMAMTLRLHDVFGSVGDYNGAYLSQCSFLQRSKLRTIRFQRPVTSSPHSYYPITRIAY